MSYIVCSYHKIPKISPGAYIFQRPFLRGLFLEGLFGGAYVRMQICISNLIGLACSGKEIYHFCRGAYIRRGDLTEGFSHYCFGGLIIGGAYTWRGLFSEFYSSYFNVVYSISVKTGRFYL